MDDLKFLLLVIKCIQHRKCPPGNRRVNPHGFLDFECAIFQFAALSQGVTQVEMRPGVRVVVQNGPPPAAYRLLKAAQTILSIGEVEVCGREFGIDTQGFLETLPRRVNLAFIAEDNAEVEIRRDRPGPVGRLPAARQ